MRTRYNFKQCSIPMTIMGMILWANEASAVPLFFNDNAAVVNQVDFRGSATNSSLGQLTINIANANAAAGLSSGYINVADSSGTWLVRNLPVFSSAIYDNPTITTNFDLGVVNGTPVITKNLSIDYSAAPSTSFSVGPTSAFIVGDVGLAQGGFMGSLNGYLGTANPALVNFNLGGLISVVYQTNHPNQQAANNQCAPMAVANSLTWLANTQGLPVPDPNDIGLKGDNTLVGELDRLMEREVRTRADGDPVGPDDILAGKLKYVAKPGLAGTVVTKHQGMLGGGDFSADGLISYGRGTAIDINFIISELQHGEDVEMGYLFPGGGHFVDITGAGFILGVPWITYRSDHLQTDEDPTDTMGTDMVDFSFLNGNTLVLEAGQPFMAFVVSESVPEPPTFALLVMAMLALFVSPRKLSIPSIA